MAYLAYRLPRWPTENDSEQSMQAMSVLSQGMPGLITDSEESETDEEGPGLQTDSDDDGETLGRRMHSQLVRVGPHRGEQWQSDMERARQRLSERERMNGGPLSEGAGGSGRGRPLP